MKPIETLWSQSTDFIRKLRIRTKAAKVKNPIRYETVGHIETLDNVRYISEHATLIK